jgi:hypothetical protein
MGPARHSPSDPGSKMIGPQDTGLVLNSATLYRYAQKITSIIRHRAALLGGLPQRDFWTSYFNGTVKSTLIMTRWEQVLFY